MDDSENEEDILDDYDAQIQSFQNFLPPELSFLPSGVALSEEGLLEMNMNIQKTGLQCIEQLRERFEWNTEEQRVLAAKCASKKDRTIKIKPTHFFKSPYYRDRGFCAPPNEDAIEKRKQLHVDSAFTLSLPWNKIERSTFIEIVKKNASVRALTPLKIRLEFLIEKMRIKLLADAVERQVLTEIDELRARLTSVKTKRFDDLWREEQIDLDWLIISNNMLKRGYDRDAEACELMWENCLKPNINRKCFTKEEDQALDELAQLYKGRNWDAIAQCLGTNRTPLQCFERYQSTLNKNLLKKFWTPEEDQKLIQAIEFCKVGDFVPWKKVIQFMNGWSLIQLQNRWERSIKPQNREGPWTTPEDAMLLLCVHFMRHRWTKISELLHGRTSYLCRERYTGVLDPDLLTGQWTWEEDKMLLQFLAVHGEKWGTISRKLPGRTDNMVNQRCNVLKRYRPDLYEKVLNSREQDVDALLPKKQFARSNICEDINSKREQIRMVAFECAKEAALEVCGTKIDVSACHNFRELAPKLTMPILREISKLLLSKCPEGLLKRPKTYYFAGHPIKAELTDSSTDDDDEEEANEMVFDDNDDDMVDDGEIEELEIQLQTMKEEEMFTQDEITLIDCELDRVLFSICILRSNEREQRQILIKNRRMNAEFNALHLYLRKAFKLKEKKIRDTDEQEADDCSEEDTWFRRLNFSVTVPATIEIFVLAVNPDGHAPVIPMNIASIRSFTVLLLIRNNHLSNWLRNLMPEAGEFFDSIIDDEDEQSSKICVLSEEQSSRICVPSEEHSSRICVPSEEQLSRICVPSEEQSSRICVPSEEQSSRICVPSEEQSSRICVPSEEQSSKICALSEEQSSQICVPSKEQSCVPSEEQSAKICVACEELRKREINSTAVQNQPGDNVRPPSHSSSELCAKCKSMNIVCSKVHLLLYYFSIVYSNSGLLSRVAPTEYQIREHVLKHPGHYFDRFGKYRARKNIRKGYYNDSFSEGDN